MIECVQNCTVTYARDMGKLDKEQWYEHLPIEQNNIHEGKIIILRNQQVHTNRPIPYSKRNIAVHGNEKVKCMLIDVAISGDRNAIKKEAEEFLKYRNRTIEIKCMWNVKTKLIRVITGASGTVSESFRQYLSNTKGNTKSRNYSKQPYWVLNTYLGK
jgi:hypothetical protein